MQSTTKDLQKAKAFWEQLKAKSVEYEKDTGKKPWFRMHPATIKLITHGEVLGTSAPGEVAYQGYRLINDASLALNRVVAEDGVMTI